MLNIDQINFDTMGLVPVVVVQHDLRPAGNGRKPRMVAVGAGVGKRAGLDVV